LKAAEGLFKLAEEDLHTATQFYAEAAGKKNKTEEDLRTATQCTAEAAGDKKT
jgi:hypothetical protein